MKRAAIIITVCLFMAAAMPTSNIFAGEHTIKSNSYFGCTDKEQFKKIFDYLIQKDMQAFKQSLAAGIVTGQCTLFNAGESVYLVETSILSGMIKIRKSGDTTEYWTVIEAIGK